MQNHTLLNPPTVRPNAAEVEIKIRRALVRNARLDADTITVTTSDTTSDRRLRSSEAWIEARIPVTTIWSC